MASLAKKYESGGRGPGTIANNRGDIGGASYGSYQIATNTGTMNSFLKYLKGASPGIYNALAGKTPGSQAFNTAWASLAKKDPAGFEQVQFNFIKQSHYDPAAAAVKKATGIDMSKRSLALQNVLWSVATQHGAGGAKNIFARAIKGPMTDEAIIRAVYAERMSGGGMKYFGKSSQSIRNSVMNRFKNELKDALAML